MYQDSHNCICQNTKKSHLNHDTVVAVIQRRRLASFMMFIPTVAIVFHTRSNEAEDDKWIWDAKAWAWRNYNKQKNRKLSNKHTKANKA